MSPSQVPVRPKEEPQEDEPKPAFCWDRMKAECNPCQDWFLKKHPEHDRPIDISTSFAPEGLQPLFYKLMALAFVAGTTIFTFVKEPRGQKWWWFAKSTNWFQFAATFYLVLSMYNTLFGASQPYRRVSSYIVKATWLSYSFASHSGLLNVLFFWLYVYEPGRTPFTWKYIVPHTAMPVTVMLDGTSVNRIPLRWQHYWGFVVPMQIMYVFWTFIQNYVAGIDNPDYDVLHDEATTLPPNASETLLNVTMDDVNATNTTQDLQIVDDNQFPDDDAIYEVYNWKDNAGEAAFVSCVGILMIGPFIFFLQWLFSQYWIICTCYGERRLYYKDPRSRRPKRDKIFQGAGLGYRATGVHSGDSSDDDEENFARIRMEDIKSSNLQEEKEEEGVESKKKYRNRFEELATRAKT